MRIVLIDDNDSRLEELRGLLRNLPSVGLVRVQKAFYMNPPGGLDAIFMTLPAAERWNPDFRSRQMQILRTSSEDQESGFPPFIVTGVNLTPEDPKDPVSQIRIILSEALAAVRLYNCQKHGRISTLGFWIFTLTSVWVTDRRIGVTAEQLSELLHQIVPNDSSLD